MKLVRIVPALAGVAVLAYLLVAAAGGRLGAKAAVPTREARAALLDTTEEVDDLMPKFLPFELSREGEVKFELDVVEGRGVTAFVIKESQREAFDKAQEDWVLGKFEHYRQFKVDNRARHRAEGRLAAGRYLVAVSEGSARNLFGGADKARVHVRVATE